jgi:hypothetical protein
MIGTIDEAKTKAKPVPPAAPTKPGSSAAKPGLKNVAGLRAKATAEPQPNAGAKPPPKFEHAGDIHES